MFGHLAFPCVWRPIEGTPGKWHTSVPLSRCVTFPVCHFPGVPYLEQTVPYFVSWSYFAHRKKDLHVTGRDWTHVTGQEGGSKGVGEMVQFLPSAIPGLVCFGERLCNEALVGVSIHFSRLMQGGCLEAHPCFGSDVYAFLETLH